MSQAPRQSCEVVKQIGCFAPTPGRVLITPKTRKHLSRSSVKSYSVHLEHKEKVQGYIMTELKSLSSSLITQGVVMCPL